jgi:ubiquinone/menaquinone biosynthesis C-methylase UbiE
MADTDSEFSGSIPTFYDRYLGPMNCAPYAADLAVRVKALAPARVLEVAAGTGIVTRAIVQVLPAGAEIVATDLNQPMLDFAAVQPGLEHVVWRQADAQQLPFEDESFDVVVCQFGVMFFPDRIAGYLEARRVLRPGGRYLFNVWDRIEENEFTAVIHAAVAAFFPDDPPRFLVRTPFGYHKVATIREELKRAGFDRIETATVALRSRAPLARDPAVGMCEGTPLRSEIEARDATRLAEATDAAAHALAARFGPGPIDGKIQAHVVTVTR